MAGLFLLFVLGLLSANKLSLLLLSDFASSLVTVASNDLLAAGVFLPYNCCCCAIFRLSPGVFLQLDLFENAIGCSGASWQI